MIFNETKGIEIVEKHKYCRSVFQKSRGLMFAKKNTDLGLVFVFDDEKRVSLHNLFVFFSIDLLFLDKKNKVVELRENFRPFTPFYYPKKKSSTIIEVTSGLIKKTNTAIGDKIKIN